MRFQRIVEVSTRNSYLKLIILSARARGGIKYYLSEKRGLAARYRGCNNTSVDGLKSAFLFS